MIQTHRFAVFIALTVGARGTKSKLTVSVREKINRRVGLVIGAHVSSVIGV